jgi:Fe-S cluster biogenesis protein NfuA
MKIKFVQSINPCLAGRQACQSVVQTSYDIIKAHGGELNVETIEEEGTTFIIKLLITPTEP